MSTDIQMGILGGVRRHSLVTYAHLEAVLKVPNKSIAELEIRSAESVRIQHS